MCLPPDNYIGISTPEGERVLPPFSPPKPKLADGLLCLLDVFNTYMKAYKYQAGMARCFVKSGQFPDESGNFYKYYSHEQSGLQLAKDIGSPISDDNHVGVIGGVGDRTEARGARIHQQG